MHKLMQIKPGLFPPVMLRTVMFSVLLQEMDALLEPGDSKLMGDKGKAEDKIQDLSFTASMRKTYSENSRLCGLVLKPRGVSSFTCR